MTSNNGWSFSRPCRYAKQCGAFDDDCTNEKSKNYGCYDVMGRPSLADVCATCPDYEPEK